MKIIVTGGSGLVGENLKLIIPNYKEHTFTFINRSKNDEYTIDLTNNSQVIDFFEKNQFDYIIHLAANVGGLYKNLKNNIKIFRDNIRINENVLEACHKNNIQRGIFCLSSCIFPQNPSKFPMDETMICESEPHPSNNGYANAKRMMYFQCDNYNRIHNREYICVIPVNLYGPFDNFNTNDGHIIPAIIHRFHLNKINNEKYICYGSGKPFRQFLYVKDFVIIICKILFNECNYNSIKPIIICSDYEDTIYNTILEISTTMNIDKNKLIWDKSKSDGCMKKTVSNNIFKEYFKDYKFTSLRDGLEETYNWFINNYDICRK